MKTIKEKKITTSLWALAYLLLAVATCIACVYFFPRFYYSPVYVSGSSMNPTFSGDTVNGCDYGIVDKHENAIKNVKRFQIVTTYYPKDKSSYKIKRIFALPGDRFKVVNNDFYLFDKKNNTWGDKIELPYKRNIVSVVRNYTTYENTPVPDNCYFVTGDNWENSLDSFSVGVIDRSLLVGVLVEMQGICTIKAGTDEVLTKTPYKAKQFLGVNY